MTSVPTQNTLHISNSESQKDNQKLYFVATTTKSCRDRFEGLIGTNNESLFEANQNAGNFLSSQPEKDFPTF